MMRTLLFSTCAAMALAISAPVWADTQPDRIGVAAAVRNQVIGVQGQGQTPLTVGSPLFRNELVRTGDNGVAQLLFADQTTISVGPRSELRLDQFVYNPSQSVGDVAFEFVRGAMRFVSGAQDPHSYSVRTPVATIGVRGTIVDFLLIDGKLIAILDEGRALFTTPDGEVHELNEPGTSYEFLPGGGVVGPAPWTGRYETGLRVASFPLYGNAYADLPEHDGVQSNDDHSDLTDEIASRLLRVIDPGEGPGEGPGEDPCPPGEGEGGHGGEGEGGWHDIDYGHDHHEGGGESGGHDGGWDGGGHEGGGHDGGWHDGGGEGGHDGHDGWGGDHDGHGGHDDHGDDHDGYDGDGHGHHGGGGGGEPH